MTLCQREGCGRRTGRRSDGVVFEHCSGVCRGLDGELSRLEDTYRCQDGLSPDAWTALVAVCDAWTEYLGIRNTVDRKRFGRSPQVAGA